jgi:small-conductance mechanosensitive channel
LAAGSLIALSLGTSLGNVHGELHAKVIALGLALVFFVLSVASTRAVAAEVSHIIESRADKAAAGVVRLMITLVGYVIVIFVTLGTLAVPVQHLLLGGALTGVVLGIAAQQSLGNVFAGIVLLFARPFTIGDRVRVRSGALGGEMTGLVVAMGLTYTSIETDQGRLNVPNSGILAAAVGPAPLARDSQPPPSPPTTALPVTAPPVTAPPGAAPRGAAPRAGVDPAPTLADTPAVDPAPTLAHTPIQGPRRS